MCGKNVGKPRIGPLRLANGQVINDPEPMANTFAAAFSSVSTETVPDNPESHQTHDGSIGHYEITVTAVMQALLNLNVSSSLGPDDSHPHLLKSCRAE